jgi:LAO/AO transport system kinase
MHRKAMAEIKDALATCLLEPVLESLAKSGELEHFAEKIKSRKADPYSVAEEVAQRFFKKQEEE